MFQYYVARATFYWKKTLLLVLVGITIYELYEVCNFFLFEYPELNTALKEHAVSQSKVQELLAEAVAASAVSGLNIFFAVRLHKVAEKVAEFIDIVSSSGLVVLHTTVIEWLSRIDYVAIWHQLR